MHRHMRGARGGQAEWQNGLGAAASLSGHGNYLLDFTEGFQIFGCVSASLRVLSAFCQLRTNQRTGWARLGAAARLRDARWAEPGETSAMFLLRPSPGDPADLEWKPLGSCQIVRL